MTEFTKYDVNFNIDIPPEIIEAARKIELWFKERNFKNWKLLGIQERQDG